MRYILTRDVKWGTVDDANRIRTAGEELTEDDAKQLPRNAVRVVDESQFKDGRCPECGQLVAPNAAALGAPGHPPKEGVKEPPSTQKDAPQGDNAVKAARESMMRRPDNADSGQPSWSKLPADVEAGFIAGLSNDPAKMNAGRAVRQAPANTAQLPVGADPRNLTDDQRRQAAERAPKPDASGQTMGGFGSGGERADANTGTAATVQTSTGAPAGADKP